jgi:hypothetical protein
MPPVSNAATDDPRHHDRVRCLARYRSLNDWFVSLPWLVASTEHPGNPQKRRRVSNDYPRLVNSRATTNRPNPPRGLVVGASAWIAVSWLLLMGSAHPLQPTSLSYTPAVRLMVQSMLALTIIAWPLVRLSSASRPRPVLSALLDTIAILILWQIVLWPMRLITTWPVGRVLVVDAEAIASTLLVGGIVAWTSATARGRTAGMIALLAWAIVIPAAAASRGVGTDVLHGPFVRSWTEAGLGPSELTPHAWIAPAGTGLLALMVWAVAATRRPVAAGEAPITSVS